MLQLTERNAFMVSFCDYYCLFHSFPCMRPNIWIYWPFTRRFYKNKLNTSQCRTTSTFPTTAYNWTATLTNYLANLHWHFHTQLSEDLRTHAIIRLFKEMLLIKICASSCPPHPSSCYCPPPFHSPHSPQWTFSPDGKKINCSVSDQTIAPCMWGAIVLFSLKYYRGERKKKVGPIWHWTRCSRLQRRNFQTSP